MKTKKSTHYKPSKLMHNLVTRYNSLSPMMKLIFSAEAQMRYAEEKDLLPILVDLGHAESLTNALARFEFTTPAQAKNLAIRMVEPLKRKELVLNYATNALVISDSIVFRMAYAYGQRNPSMKGFEVTHPMLENSETFQREIAFLQRINRTISFSMKNPEHSKYYKEWATLTPAAKDFHRKREHYTLAVTSAMKEMGISFKKVTLPYTGVGRGYIKEICRQRES